jgi:hypothetical protein
MSADDPFTITPKQGESFSDTMNRAAQAGKNVSPELIHHQAEKGVFAAPLVAGAAPAIGAAIPAGMAIAPELYDLAVKHLAGNVLPGMEEQAARAKLIQIAPRVAQIVKEWALPTTAIGGLIKLLTMGDSKH